MTKISPVRSIFHLYLAAQKLLVWRDIVPEQHFQTPKYQLSVTASSGTVLELLGQLIQISASELLKMDLTL